MTVQSTNQLTDTRNKPRQVAGVLMGGSGSTGSSLLRTVLNRHSLIFSGEELNFFNKEQFFMDWIRYRSSILQRHHRKLATRGFFPYPGDQLLHADYGWDRDSLQSLVESSPTLMAFVDGFFAPVMNRHDARVWIEKTPSNCYSFSRFLQMFPEGRVVHTTRNPLDSVASLVRRGMDPYFASGLWLYNTAAAMAVDDDLRYCLVKYEDLTDRQEDEVARLVDFLGLSFEREVLQESQSDTLEHATNPGWRHARTAPIQKADVPTFELIDESLQRQIVETLSALRVSSSHQQSRGIKYSSCEQVCGKLGYEFHPRPCRTKNRLALRRWFDMTRRSWKGYATGWTDYPLGLGENT